MLINNKIKNGIIILLSILFGFLLSNILSILTSKPHVDSVKIALVLEHRKMGIISLQNDDIDEALFHFRSAIYLINDENIQNTLKEISESWTFFYTLKGAVAALARYAFDFDIGDMKSAPGKTILVDVTALHAYSLEKNGDFEAAKQGYKEAANFLEF